MGEYFGNHEQCLKGPHSPKMHCVPLLLNPEFRVTQNFQRLGKTFYHCLFSLESCTYILIWLCVNTFPVYHCIVFLCYFVYIQCKFVKLVVWSWLVQDQMAAFSHCRVGRLKFPGSLKSIRLRESIFNLWRGRKHSLGFEERTNSEFGIPVAPKVSSWLHACT